MTIEICNALAAHCAPDWNGVSAIATLSATIAALYIPFRQRRQDRAERRKALAYSLFIKTVKINSDVAKLWDHVQDQRRVALGDGVPPDIWGSFSPLATLPTSVKYSADELAVLFDAKDDDAFNAVLSLDELHASDIAVMRLYAEKRATLVGMLPGSISSGRLQGISLIEAEKQRITPYSVELDMLVASISKDFEDHAAATRDALLRLHTVLHNKLNLPIGLSLPSPTGEMQNMPVA